MPTPAEDIPRRGPRVARSGVRFLSVPLRGLFTLGRQANKKDPGPGPGNREFGV
jgi:hypothetical protein